MKLQIPLLAVSIALFAAGIAFPTQSPKKKVVATASTINFNRDIKPILSENCFKCHGPDAAVTAAGLRLDTFEHATKARGGRPGIVPGKPQASLIWKRIDPPVDSMVMPPPKSGMKPLTARQKLLIKQWIASGAKYEQHWSFVTPKAPPLPKVSNEAWIKNDIDRFVLARLDQAKLKPEPEADRPTLIRRASIALTGMPPTPAEVDAFVADTQPKAYERLVDRLLQSPRYGEHQARYWLDAVRYGDTHGLHLDNERAIFPYRDWVVRAMNDDLSFDKFTLWQMAGDLLPKPTTDQLIATGYIRMNPTTAEGGAIEEEFLAKNTFDRVDTTSTVFLGITVGCARCHDHKFDPVSQKDYYRLFAFFNSTTDKPLDDNALAPAPAMRAPTADQEQQLKAYDATLDALLAKVTQEQALGWLKSAYRPPVATGAWEVSPTFAAASFDEAFATAYAPEKGESVEWKKSPLALGKELPNFVGKENAAAYLRSTIDAPQARDLTLRVSSDDAVKVWLNGTPVHSNKALRGVSTATDTVNLSLKAGANSLLIKIVNGTAGDGVLVRLGDEISERIDREHVRWTTGKPEERRPRELASTYLEIGPDTPDAKEYRSTKKTRDEFEAAIPMTLIAQEMPKPRPAFVLRRGEYNLPADKVARGIPAVLGGLPKDAPVNRLGLAKWLTSDQNPLVARVFVNRIWQQHFGTGLVKTAEDFGSQGDWPVNLPLLDHLAVSFRKNGWSVKDLHRQILTSAAFRQRATATKLKLERDPENRLASRGPRFRLEGEVIRDAALAASGLLVERLGGRGFKPYQPEGIWEAIAYPDSNTARYMKDNGPDIYRRSLYMFWKRTSPHPVLMSFDAPMRESCTVRRGRTNTPLQALVTLNETSFVEASRAMAARLLKEAKSDDERLVHAYQLTLGRRPSPKEREVLGKAFARYRALYQQNPKAAEQLVSVGDAPRDTTVSAPEQAAWTLICSTLINTDEFLTQH